MKHKKIGILFFLLISVVSFGFSIGLNDTIANKIQDIISSGDLKLARRTLSENKPDLNLNNHETWYYHHLLSQIEDKEAHFETDNEHFEKEIEIAQIIKRQDLEIKSLINYASHYEANGNFKQALHYYLKTLDILELRNDETEKAYIYSKLGLIFYADLDYTTAIKYFTESFRLFSAHKNEQAIYAYWVQNNLSNIGLCYGQLKNYRKAIFYNKLALKFCESAKFEQNRPIGVISSNLGAIFGALGYYDLGIRYLIKGINLSLKPENDELEHGVESIVVLAKLYSLKGDFTNANLNYKRAKDLIEKYGLYSITVNYDESYSMHLYRTKDYKNAYLYNMKFIHLKDSAENALQKIGYSKQILMHNIEKQKVENDLLLKTNQVKTIQNKLIIALIIVFFIICLFILFSLKQSAKRNAELEALNEKVTDQKNKLELLNQQLVKRNLNKSYLIQTVAHDLRTPIGNIMSLSNLMFDTEHNKQEFNEYLGLIDYSSKNAITIIEDILDQSAIELGKLKLNLSPASIQKCISDSLKMLNFRLEPKSITVITEYEEDETVFLDEDRFKRVIINIISNSVKFSPKNSKIEIKQLKKDGKYLITIKDYGIGMSSDILEQIFDRNTVAGRNGLENEKTIGVGLSIAKTIIEGHYGKIWAESEPDKGSMFYIELPIGNHIV